MVAFSSFREVNLSTLRVLAPFCRLFFLPTRYRSSPVDCSLPSVGMSSTFRSLWSLHSEGLGSIPYLRYSIPLLSIPLRSESRCSSPLRSITRVLPSTALRSLWSLHSVPGSIPTLQSYRSSAPRILAPFHSYAIPLQIPTLRFTAFASLRLYYRPFRSASLHSITGSIPPFRSASLHYTPRVVP